jgi:hypothetical protein
VNINLPIQRIGGFTGAVDLTLEGNLDGLEYNFNPSSASGAGSQLSLTAAPNAPTGLRALTVRGTATINAQTVTRTGNFPITIVSSGQ